MHSQKKANPTLEHKRAKPRVYYKVCVWGGGGAGEGGGREKGMDAQVKAKDPEVSRVNMEIKLRKG